MGIKVCVNQGASPFWGPERGYNRGNFGYVKTSSHKPLAWMHWYLMWSNLVTRRLKCAQIKFLGL